MASGASTEEVLLTNHDAIEEGYDAYWDGLACEDNPHEPEKDPEKHKSWDEGWRAARKHDDDESEGTGGMR